MEQVIEAQLQDSNRRRSIWVDPAFQKRFMLWILSLVIFVSSILVGSFWYISQQSLRAIQVSGIPTDHPLFQLVSQRMSYGLWGVIAVAIAFSVFVLIMARSISHRIVGPVAAIKRSLISLSEGRLADAKIELRKDDEFQELAGLINSSIDQLTKGK